MNTNYKLEQPIIKFARIISSVYSNFEQSQNHPSKFAHIIINFIPLPLEDFNGPSFYSEQSYSYNKWDPYIQSIIKIDLKDQDILLKSYSIKYPEKFAGCADHMYLLNNISKSKIKAREGCSMIFKEVYDGIYKGKLLEDKKCTIQRGNNATYLVSEVEFDKENWKSLDIGLNTSTNKQEWGSTNGPLKFKRIKDLGGYIDNNWINR